MAELDHLVFLFLLQVLMTSQDCMKQEPSGAMTAYKQIQLELAKEVDAILEKSYKDTMTLEEVVV